MRIFILPLIFACILILALGAWLWRRLRPQGAGRWAFWGATAIMVALLTLVLSLSDSLYLARLWMLYAFISLMVALIFFAVTVALWRSRRGVLAGGVVAAVILTMMAWGAFVTRLNPEVKERTVRIDSLPPAFDGYRIAQLSDIHVGTHGSDTAYLSRVVDMVNALNPDVILLTGDLVNISSAELPPHIPVLSRLNAPDGVFSILGNHDYADYAWKMSPDQRRFDRRQMIRMQQQMGWTLLLDSTAVIHRGTDSLLIVGVENIGDHPFPVYGSLQKACPDSSTATRILLTHNPRHWHDSIRGNSSAPYPLTLSGHTHAMQMRWGHFSPAAWRYPEWDGIYTDSLGHILNVNIGIGSLGIPSRLGNARPEITLITLRNH